MSSCRGGIGVLSCGGSKYRTYLCCSSLQYKVWMGLSMMSPLMSWTCSRPHLTVYVIVPSEFGFVMIVTVVIVAGCCVYCIYGEVVYSCSDLDLDSASASDSASDSDFCKFCFFFFFFFFCLLGEFLGQNLVVIGSGSGRHEGCLFYHFHVFGNPLLGSFVPLWPKRVSLVDALESPLVVGFPDFVVLLPLLKVFSIPNLDGFFLFCNDFQLKFAASKVLRIHPLEFVDGFSAHAFQHQTPFEGMIGVFPMQQGLVATLQTLNGQPVLGGTFVVLVPQSDFVHGLLDVLSRNRFRFGEIFENGWHGGSQIGIVPDNCVLLVDFFFVFFFFRIALLQIRQRCQRALPFDVFELIIAILVSVIRVKIRVVVLGGRFCFFAIVIAAAAKRFFVGISGNHVGCRSCLLSVGHNNRCFLLFLLFGILQCFWE
mmetsp:Transcript_14638/g.36824  ORF Transcript_14638/g.36824 Transcript_14638/m.36824 type:complete len:427 (-) Transcript_14638:904-2184(-)